MLVLLILFIITLPVMTNSTSLHIGGGPTPPTPREAIELSIDFDGTIFWNGAEVRGLTQLESYFRSEAARADQAEVHVMPDRRAKYDAVARVLAIAQRSGMQRIGFAGQERFEE
jgi:biopolymer transport protein ExbD